MPPVKERHAALRRRCMRCRSLPHVNAASLSVRRSFVHCQPPSSLGPRRAQRHTPLPPLAARPPLERCLQSLPRACCSLLAGLRGSSRSGHPQGRQGGSRRRLPPPLRRQSDRWSSSSRRRSGSRTRPWRPPCAPSCRWVDSAAADRRPTAARHSRRRCLALPPPGGDGDGAHVSLHPRLPRLPGPLPLSPLAAGATLWYLLERALRPQRCQPPACRPAAGSSSLAPASPPPPSLAAQASAYRTTEVVTTLRGLLPGARERPRACATGMTATLWVASTLARRTTTRTLPPSHLHSTHKQVAPSAPASLVATRCWTGSRPL